MTRRPILAALALAQLAAASWALAQGDGNGGAPAATPAPPTAPAPATPPAASVAPYQRAVEGEGGGSVRLEMAIREFAPPREGMPAVYLAGAVHIANPSYYKSLQEFLDRQDVVLFEGVKPPGAGSGEHDRAGQTPEQKARATEKRIRFLAMAVERHRARNGSLPESLPALAEASEGRFAQLVRASLIDAWGNPIEYQLTRIVPAPDAAPEDRSKTPAVYDLLSLGADAAAGGEGAGADLRFSAQKPLKKSETGERSGSGGIQQKLADATGLVFQLTAMDHNKPNWRNSDLSLDQIQERLEAAGADADTLFGMLEGSSLMGRFAGMMLSLFSGSPEQRAMLRLMMIEMLGRADELMSLRMPADMGAMMAVILEDRNKVLVDDIRRIVESEPAVKTIGAIYGAGHLPGVERALVSELGYRPAGDTWVVAMEVDASRDGLSAAQIAATRRMIGQTLQRQLDQAAREKDRKKKATESGG